MYKHVKLLHKVAKLLLPRLKLVSTSDKTSNRPPDATRREFLQKIPGLEGYRTDHGGGEKYGEFRSGLSAINWKYETSVAVSNPLATDSPLSAAHLHHATGNSTREPSKTK